MFDLLATHSSGARRGQLTTAHGTIQTPFFMPIATKGTVKTMAPHELVQLEAAVDPTTDPIVLSNTYHLYLKPGVAQLRRFGGLHSFMNWPGSILTDSGGFQIFSLARLSQRDADGVEFRSHIDGSRHRFTPEDSMEIQSVIGSDIWMAFDYFPGYPASPEDIAESVDLTTAWAKRCRAWFDHYMTTQPAGSHQLFGIVQGSTDADQRRRSAEAVRAIGFDGYAIGGLAVGEPADAMYRAIEATTPHLPVDQPRYLMGVGMPEQIVEAVKRGVDMFDCVLPTRNARHGTIFVHRSDHPDSIVDAALTSAYYDKLNIKAASLAADARPLDPHCRCDTCASGYSRAYLRHLFSIQEPLAARLATIHNVTFYRQLLFDIRQAITVGQ